jgi:diguanylate cyclase (GGDEF)-like protein
VGAVKPSTNRNVWIYAVGLFTLAVIALGWSLYLQGTGLSSGGDWGAAALFVLFGLFTISVGFPHPHFGHVSFDRVAQVATILIFGATDAAWMSGLASLLFPWQRLWRGESLSQVLLAVFHNAGLMTLLILICGTLYEKAAGPVPLGRLDLDSLWPLLVLIVSLQVLNDLAMAVLLAVQKGEYFNHFNIFTTIVELSSALDAILVAIVFTRLEWPVFLLLLLLLSLGMGVLKSFAEFRFRLEELVVERTRQLEEKTHELDRLAREDPLTGLANRRSIDERLEREIERARRYLRPLSVAMADLDHFKQVNDRYSHGVGDQVLIRVAETLVSRCRTSDLVSRYGGEEFLLCFPETSAESAYGLCESMRQAVADLDWSDVAPGLTVTISFGVAQVQNLSSLEVMLDTADQRLYQAKNDGRNRVVGS